MTYYPGTPLPHYPTTPLTEIDYIIFDLWDTHLELELASPHSEVQNLQHLEVTAAVIEYWENKLTEINKYEVQQRRLNSYKDSRRQ